MLLTLMHCSMSLIIWKLCYSSIRISEKKTIVYAYKQCLLTNYYQLISTIFWSKHTFYSAIQILEPLDKRGWYQFMHYYVFFLHFAHSINSNSPTLQNKMFRSIERNKNDRYIHNKLIFYAIIIFFARK